jgi:hypothetical protein
LFALGSSNSEGAFAEFQNPFSVKNVDFKIRDFTPLIKIVLGGLVY